MRGEELQTLNIEELQQLEKSLESGLSRVMEKKVFSLSSLLVRKSHFLLIYGSVFMSQGERIMKEITDLQRKVKFHRQITKTIAKRPVLG